MSFTNPFAILGQRVHRDRSDERKTPPNFIANDSPTDAADQHANHLQIQQQNAFGRQSITGNADVFETGNPHDAEQDDIVQINEITQRRRQHGNRQTLFELWSFSISQEQLIRRTYTTRSSRNQRGSLLTANNRKFTRIKYSRPLAIIRGLNQ
jgi:hypothetical protein